VEERLVVWMKSSVAESSALRGVDDSTIAPRNDSVSGTEPPVRSPILPSRSAFVITACSFVIASTGRSKPSCASVRSWSRSPVPRAVYAGSP
jgi:hypothetical protein